MTPPTTDDHAASTPEDLPTPPPQDETAEDETATDEPEVAPEAEDGEPEADAPAPAGHEADGPTFADIGLRQELVDALEGLGYEEPTPIQRDAIPPMIRGLDVLGQAATGTGKTAAFALPLLHRLAPGDRGAKPTALVLVPTRELAMQVSQAVHRYGRTVGARVVPIYGGQPIFRQLKSLQSGVDVVVATPGRAIDHLSRGSLELDAIEVVVLDEADEMLDMGFSDDIEAIVSATPDTRQTALFSATMPGRIKGLAKRYMTDPVRIELAAEAKRSDGDALIRQVAYVVHRNHKPAALGRILDVESPGATIVFCRTRVEVDTLTETLNGRGYKAESLHGGMDQGMRDRVVGRLRAKTADLLVATDVAARGLDVDHLTHVVNYDVPTAADSFVHRIGRVGRAGREGVAITLVEPRQHRMLKAIERHTGTKMDVEKVPTVADLRALQLELTRTAIRETLLEEDYESMRSIVDSLTDEFDIVEVAMAAVRLAHEATGNMTDEQELPDPSLRPERSEAPASAGRGARTTGSSGKGRRAPSADMVRLYVGLGRMAHIRPGDLVGAIAGETSLSGKQIGAIEITQRFSLVEVPKDAAEEVIEKLERSTIKGRRPSVRLDRDTN
jgi:ATP-dependent RNA helicase DeaD